MALETLAARKSSKGGKRRAAQGIGLGHFTLGTRGRKR